MNACPFKDTSSAADVVPDDGAAHCTCDDDTNVAGTGGWDPNAHASSSESTKFDPYTVTSVPPDDGPLAGDTPDTPAAAMYRYCTPSDE